MRIIRIEIKNFCAFYNHHIIKLAKSGQRGKSNLLIYGENGSGKSSLLLAIKYLLESGINNLNFNNYLNIFKLAPDIKASAVYLRTAFENILKKFCNDKYYYNQNNSYSSI